MHPAITVAIAIVLYAESAARISGLQRTDVLGFGPRTRCYEVGILGSLSGGAERGDFDERYRGCGGQQP